MFPESLYNLNPFSGVSATGNSTANVIVATPEPFRIHRALIEYMSDNAGTVERRTKAVMLTEIDTIEVYINNKLQRKDKLADLFEDLEMRGETIEDGLIPVVFARDERQLTQEQNGTDFFTGVGDQMVIKVKMLAATTPDLKLMLVYDRFQNDGNRYPGLDSIMAARGRMRQLIETHRIHTVNVNKTGLLQFSLDPQERSLSCVKLRTSDVSWIAIYRGNDKKWEGTPTDFDLKMKHRGYTPQAGVIHFFPEAWAGGSIAGWYLFKGLPLRFELTMTAAVSFDADIYENGDAYR